MAAKGGLGKGLNAIFMENDIDRDKSTMMVRISEIEPNKKQPRTDFDPKALAELADSISKHGVLQPLLVRPIVGTDGYQLIAGERRWRASRMAGLTEVPVIVKDADESEVMQFALIENLQREDLNPIEEAKGYKSLIEKFGFTQEEVSKSVGKSRSAVTNTLRILGLPENVINMISQGKISAGHARALLAFDEKDVSNIAEDIIKKGLSVRQLEAMAQIQKTKASSKKVKKTKRPVFFNEVEIALKEKLGRKVKVINKDQKSGVLQIEFYSQNDLSDIVNSLESGK